MRACFGTCVILPHITPVLLQDVGFGNRQQSEQLTSMMLLALRSSWTCLALGLP